LERLPGVGKNARLSLHETGYGISRFIGFVMHLTHAIAGFTVCEDERC